MSLALLAACGGGGLSAEEKAACTQAAHDGASGLRLGSADLSALDHQGIVNDFGSTASKIREDIAGLGADSKVQKAGESLAQAFDAAAVANTEGAFTLPPELGTAGKHLTSVCS